MTLGFGFDRQVRSALVKLHDDVGVQRGLDLHADLGRQKQLVTIHRRGELDTFFADLAHLAQAPNLKAAAVSEDRFVPFFELVQAAEFLDHIQSWAHPQMKGVTQNDLGVHVGQALGCNALDGAVGTHRHEDGGLHHAVVEREAAAAGVAAQISAISAGGVVFKEVEFQHGRIVLGGEARFKLHAEATWRRHS